MCEKKESEGVLVHGQSAPRCSWSGLSHALLFIVEPLAGYVPSLQQGLFLPIDQISLSYIQYQPIGLMSRVFINGPGDWGSIPG